MRGCYSRSAGEFESFQAPANVCLIETVDGLGINCKRSTKGIIIYFINQIYGILVVYVTPLIENTLFIILLLSILSLCHILFFVTIYSIWHSFVPCLLDALTFSLENLHSLITYIFHYSMNMKIHRERTFALILINKGNRFFYCLINWKKSNLSMIHLLDIYVKINWMPIELYHTINSELKT